MNDLSFDIETLGLGSGAHILSIAAVPFDRATGEVWRSRAFHLHVAGDQQRKIDPNTVAWWMKQDPAARQRVFCADSEWSLERALTELVEWIDGEEFRVWGNGAHFDIGILENAFQQYSMKIPWNYRNVRDMRTIVDLARESGADPKDNFQLEGVAHDALDDAVYQAHVIAKAYQMLINTENFEPPTVNGEVV